MCRRRPSKLQNCVRQHHHALSCDEAGATARFCVSFPAPVHGDTRRVVLCNYTRLTRNPSNAADPSHTAVADMITRDSRGCQAHSNHAHTQAPRTGCEQHRKATRQRCRFLLKDWLHGHVCAHKTSAVHDAGRAEKPWHETGWNRCSTLRASHGSWNCFACTYACTCNTLFQYLTPRPC